MRDILAKVPGRRHAVTSDTRAGVIDFGHVGENVRTIEQYGYFLNQYPNG